MSSYNSYGSINHDREVLMIQVILIITAIVITIVACVLKTHKDRGINMGVVYSGTLTFNFN